MLSRNGSRPRLHSASWRASLEMLSGKLDVGDCNPRLIGGKIGSGRVKSITNWYLDICFPVSCPFVCLLARLSRLAYLGLLSKEISEFRNWFEDPRQVATVRTSARSQTLGR